jgi:branched-chain amino acid transport system ATP-binding protein
MPVPPVDQDAPPSTDPPLPAEVTGRVESPGSLSAERVPVLTVSEVAVRFGGVAALSSVSLTARAGAVTGLIGPNGAGKTTLFNVISGLQEPDEGKVTFGRTNLAGVSPHRRARMGIARTFQRLELFGTLTAGENVQVGLESAVKWWQWRHLRASFPWRRGPLSAGGESAAVQDPGGPGALAVTTADRLLTGVGLEGMSLNQASAMPTGSARMVELARALAIGPKLLLLDEPGSGLDDTESEALGTLLTRLASSGMAIVLVEHDMELVMRICDTVHVLDFGRVVASGTPDEVRSDPAVQSAYLGAGVTPGSSGDATADHVDGPGGDS